MQGPDLEQSAQGDEANPQCSGHRGRCWSVLQGLFSIIFYLVVIPFIGLKEVMRGNGVYLCGFWKRNQPMVSDDIGRM